MGSPARYLDMLSDEECRSVLTACCGSERWVDAMLAGRPFGSDDTLFRSAEAVWWSLTPDDWREAFDHHPRIGARPETMSETGSKWAAEEQAGTAEAGARMLESLAAANEAYEDRFGHVFLICATGLSAEKMLRGLRDRLDNPPNIELRIAAGEQAKITRLRLEKLETA